MDTISHLALEGIVVWFLLKKYNKEALYLQNRKRRVFFLGILTVSILPDFDILLGMHRAYTHSLTWPSLCLVVGIGLLRWGGFRSESNKNLVQIQGISLLVISFLWYSHILLDVTGPYAMGLLYPFSDNQYELVISIIFNSFEGRFESVKIGWREITLQTQIQESNGIWESSVPAYPFYLLFFFIIFVLHPLIRSSSEKA